MNLADLRASIGQERITILAAREHARATEKYIDMVFSYPGYADRDGSVPYQYRRTGLFLDTAAEIAAHIEQAYAALEPSARRKWVARERRQWNREHQDKPATQKVTKAFFDRLPQPAVEFHRQRPARKFEPAKADTRHQGYGLHRCNASTA